jgi:hypothetical protein
MAFTALAAIGKSPVFFELLIRNLTAQLRIPAPRFPLLQLAQEKDRFKGSSTDLAGDFSASFSCKMDFVSLTASNTEFSLIKVTDTENYSLPIRH